MEEYHSNYSNTSDPSATLEDLNEAELIRLTPVIVYLVFLSLSGAAGNSIVFHVYRTKYRASNSKYFVISLCVIDLFSCIVAMPLEIATVLNQYTFDNVWLCKTSRFSNYISAMSSSWLIALIAVERYRKICKPFRWQISIKVGKYLSIICILTGILCSVPAIFIFGKKSHYIPRYGINGTECSTDDDMSGKALPKFHLLLSGFLFGIDVVLIVVLYIIVGITILRHEQAMPKHFRFRKDVSPGPQSFSHSVDFDSNHVPALRCHSADDRNLDTNKNTLAVDDIRARTFSASNGKCKIAISSSKYDTHISGSKSLPASKTTGNTLPATSNLYPELSNDLSGNSSNCISQHIGRSSSQILPPHECNTDRAKNKSNSKHFTSRQASVRKTALLMFTVSVVFVICYTPHLILMFCRLLDKNFVDKLSDSERALYKFFLRSYFVNYAINPIIYCLCGTKFRSQCKELFCRRSTSGV